MKEAYANGETEALATGPPIILGVRTPPQDESGRHCGSLETRRFRGLLASLLRRASGSSLSL